MPNQTAFLPFLLLLALALSLALSACSRHRSEEEQEPVEISSSSQEEPTSYKTVVIGTQTWFAENLYDEPRLGNSWCYGNSASYCEKYGKLYDWEGANNACPGGWKLPSKGDYSKLLEYDGAKAQGFEALLGGWRVSENSFRGIDEEEYWWLSNESGSLHAENYWIKSGSIELAIGSGPDYKTRGFYVRCIKR